MARPKAVVWSNFELYDKLHTKKVNYYSGAQLTILYPMKETEKYFQSIESWSSLCGATRVKKTDSLKLEIPILTDEKAIDLLQSITWKNHIQEEINHGNSQIFEAVNLLRKIFPDKKKGYVYDLNNIIHNYTSGQLFEKDSYDKDGFNFIRYFNLNLARRFVKIMSEDIKILWETLNKETNESLKSPHYSKLFEADEKFAYENHNLIPQCIEIGKASVCYPVAFSEGTADWHLKEYGKTCAYAHAGEIYFVTTHDKVFF